MSGNTNQTTTLSHIEFSLSNMRSRYNQALGQLQLKQQERDRKTAELSHVRQDLELWPQVQILFSKVSEYARAQLKARIEETVTAALQAVFEDDSEFRIHMRTLGGVPAAEWLLVSSKGEEGTKVISDTEDGDGGGANDTVSLALRAALLELSRPRPQGPFILDEPGKMIDKTARPNTAQFVKQYVANVKRQGLLITHHDELADVADVSYRVWQENGISEVQRI